MEETPGINVRFVGKLVQYRRQLDLPELRFCWKIKKNIKELFRYPYIVLFKNVVR